MNEEFKIMSEQFLSHKADLPQTLSWKLQYIIDRINEKSKPFHNLSPTQQLEVKEMQLLDKEALKLVFISIAKSIIIPEFHQALDRNCYIKIVGYFQKWEKALINTDSANIFFKKKNEKLRFPLKGLQLKLKDHSKKIEFFYKNSKKATIKFLTKGSAESMTHKLLDLVNAQELNESKQNSNRYINMSSHPFQQDYHSFLMKSNATILIHKKQPKIYAELQIHCPHNHIFELISFFANQNAWNKNVRKEQILKQKNKVFIKRQYKHSSFFTSDRKTKTQLVLEPLDFQNYLLLESNTSSAFQKNKGILGSIQSSLLCRLSSQNEVSLRFQCYFKAHGYCSQSQNRKMMMEMFKDLLHFENCFNSPKKQRKQFLMIFDPSEYANINFKKQEAFKSLINEEVQEMTDNFETIKNDDGNDEPFLDFGNEDLAEDNSQSQSQQIEQKENQLHNIMVNRFKKLRPRKYEDKFALEYISMIKHKDYEKYYQNFYFDQNNREHFEAYDPWYCLSQLLAKGGQYKVTENKELFFINQQLIQGQKDTLKFVIKQIGANIISGKSVMNVSLPVDIFEARSLLERAAASYGCAPSFLRPISQSDPFTQIKNVFTFIASVPTLQLIMQKPFNPILGETFQGYLQGIPIYYEQISHHPPISSYLMKCKEYTMYGNLVAFANVGLNTGIGGNSGAMHIVMENGSHFECYFPPGQISGLIYGQRKFRSFGRGYVIERKHKLFCEFSIEKDSKGVYERKKQKMKPGDIIGGIFQVTDQFLTSLEKLNSMKKFTGLKKEAIVKKLGQISGVWFEDIYLNDELINKNSKSYPIEYHENVLPSDSNFRLDVMMHRLGDLRASQKQKQVLEDIQRADRKLRQKMSKAKK